MFSIPALTFALGLGPVELPPPADSVMPIPAQHSPCNPVIRPDCAEPAPDGEDEDNSD